MNVSCPKCEAVFRVDPAKVPVKGVRARCSSCSAVFFVGRPTEPSQVVSPVRPGAGSILEPLVAASAPASIP
ncbi:MAG TPA: zinc-ribbon domain-containing protein, partial [Gemmatimonadales bacterium]|nr:zinc-ribbon domain-containing protein [Gemmatimonadales bacterium]